LSGTGSHVIPVDEVTRKVKRLNRGAPR
jgi:hypothetical protein